MNLENIKNIDDVKAAISRWDSNREDAEALKGYVADISYFEINISEIPSPAEEHYLHVYIGPVSINGAKKACIFYIMDDKDTAAYAEELFDFIGFSEGKTESRDPIDEQVALDRIESWANDHEEWIDAKVESEFGVFQAFVVPASDLNTTSTFHAYFALQPVLGVPNASEAELVLYDPVSKASYYNTVRIVPPFSSLETHQLYQDNFFLLKESVPSI